MGINHETRKINSPKKQKDRNKITEKSGNHLLTFVFCTIENKTKKIQRIRYIICLLLYRKERKKIKLICDMIRVYTKYVRWCAQFKFNCNFKRIIFIFVVINFEFTNEKRKKDQVFVLW